MMGGASKTLVTLRRSYPVHEVLGVRPARILDESSYSESTAGPAVAGAFQALLVCYITGVVSAAVANLDVTLHFHSHMYEPVSLTVS